MMYPNLVIIGTHVIVTTGVILVNTFIKLTLCVVMHSPHQSQLLPVRSFVSIIS